MKTNLFFISLILFISTVFSPRDSLAEPSGTKVILMEPIMVNNKMVAEPGQIAYCLDTDTSTYPNTVTLEVNDKKYPKIDEDNIIPFDSLFSASKIYIYLIDSYKHSEGTMDYARQVEHFYYLSKNMCTLFPEHPLYHDLYWLYYKYADQYYELNKDEEIQKMENNEKGKVFPPVYRIIDTYLANFPNGKYYDAFQWEKIKQDNYVYEYEGYAGEAVKQINAYEDYLKQHPQSKVRDEIMFKIAYICRIAQECIENPPEEAENNNNADSGSENSNPYVIPPKIIDYNAGFKPEDADYYRDKAINYYKKLMESTDILTREKARVAIFSIKQHRRIYCEDNDWLQYKYD
jgi:hypothetical protein